MKDKYDVIQFWMLQDPVLTRSALRVLARLVQHQNPKSGRCDPSYAGLASDLRLSTKSVQNAIAELLAKKAIRVIDGRRGRRNRYKIMSVQEHETRVKKEENLASKSTEAEFPLAEKQTSYEKKKKREKKRGRQNGSLKVQRPWRDKPARHVRQEDGEFAGEQKRSRQSLQALENSVGRHLEALGQSLLLLMHAEPSAVDEVYHQYERGELAFNEAKAGLLKLCIHNPSK
ncbi:MAG: helix-turn-helix domain-containing protein [Pseudomonadota bacterium]